MKKIILNNTEYEIIENRKECFCFEEVNDLFTDYFYPYDFILGDYAGGKLRLKGFYDSKNKKVNKINDIKDYKNYVDNYCATNCGYFLLKKN